MENELYDRINGALLKEGIKGFKIIIENVSGRHSGHFNGNGNSHFNITIKSEELKKLLPLKRHKILNNSIDDLLKNDIIHAVSFSVQ